MRANAPPGAGPRPSQDVSPWRRLACMALVTGLAPAAVALAPESASAAEAASSAPPEAATSFGNSMPSDQFIRNFQQQLSRQLGESLERAQRESDERMRKWEEMQRKSQETLRQLQEDLASRSVPRQAPGPEDETTIVADPPKVHTRRVASEAGHRLDTLTKDAADRPAGFLPTDSSDTPPPHTGRASVIAPHGFVEGRLLNGVVATAGGPDRESVVALTGLYQSANGFTSNLDGCLALVQGHSDLAAGRIDFKLSRLTCNFPGGASRTWDASGWLVDADGIRGLRAVLVSNLGSKAALASLGGAIDGLGQRLSQEQYRNSISALGSTSSFSGSPGRDAAAGAAGGAARSSTQAINEAYALFPPSLQVGGGTSVTVVLANDLRVPPQGSGLTSTFAARAP